MVMEEIYCKDCGQKLTRENKICPNCGSKNKVYEIKVEEKIELHDQIKGKVKRRGFRRSIKEFKVGDDLHRKSGKWHHREMDIDRENNQYKEVVKDKITGKIIHKCKEPLSKHKGHGSAKRKRRSKNEDQ